MVSPNLEMSKKVRQIGYCGLSCQQPLAILKWLLGLQLLFSILASPSFLHIEVKTFLKFDSILTPSTSLIMSLNYYMFTLLETFVIANLTTQFKFCQKNNKMFMCHLLFMFLKIRIKTVSLFSF